MNRAKSLSYPRTDDRRRVLLVEDDAALRRAAERCARSMPSIQLVAVASAGEARAQLEQAPFDVVIADYHLADPSEPTSVALVLELRARGVEVHVVTGAIEEAKAALGDVAPVLPKPVDLFALLEPGSDATPVRSETRLKGARREGRPPVSQWVFLLIGVAVGVALGGGAVWWLSF